MTTLVRERTKPPRKEAPPRWRTLDPVLILVALALSAFGIIAVYAAGVDGQATYATNQAIGFVLGLVLAVPIALIDYRVWQRHLRAIYALVILMLLAVTFFGIVAGGAESWIYVGGVQVQPSEFAKPLMIVVLAGYFAEKPVREYVVFLKALGILAVPTLLVFSQPDLGTALVFGAIFTIMAFVAGARLVQIGGLLVAAAVGAFAAIKTGVLQEYQVARLTGFLNPSCTDDVTYQVCYSKMAIGSGGLTGKGLDAQTLADLNFLPEDHTDFIFSNLAERVGFLGSLTLIVLFFLLVWRMLHVATVSRDRFGVLIAVGVATMFLFHILVNIGMTMGIMPVTGLPLPFISYGRSNLVVCVVSLGLLQSIASSSRAEVSKRPKV